MKTPEYWTSRGMIACVLWPLSWLYRGIHAWNMAQRKPHRLPVPLICVGNATAGGAGKTPVVIALHALLRDYYPHVACLSRGYKGRIQRAVCVDVIRHTASDVGDEPLLIARNMPCWVAPKRTEAADAAVNAGVQLLLMDDGLQNPTLIKTLVFMVVDGGFGFGNGWVLPAGPLREPLSNAWTKTDAVVLVGDDAVGSKASIPLSKPVFTARFEAVEPLPDSSVSWVAFAGIGRPQKFYETLCKAGLDVKATYDFADHYAYTPEDMERLLHAAQALGARLITTEKDGVRIPTRYQQHVTLFPVRLVFDDPEAVLKWMLPRLTV